MTEPLVLLPGMMCDDRLFTPQIRAFCPERAVTIAPMSHGDRVEDMAKDLLEHLPQKFALAGLSMGGIVAMEVLNRAPDRVTRLCLMDTNPLAESAAVAAAREPMIIGAQAGRLDEVMREAMQPEFLAPGPKRLDVLNLMYQMAADLGPELFVRQSRALQRRPDQQATLRKYKLPTLILCGEHDKLTPVRRHEFMAELIPGAHLEIIPNAGHIPTLEQPEVTNAAMRVWLDQRVDG